MDEAQRVGEVIEASTADFVAQCYELYELPALGSLVKTREQEVEIFGVVYRATTTGFEPGRRPIARGRDEASEEALYRANPQLAKLLKSEFGALVVGHRTGDKLHHYLPPKPVHIHGFVYQCSPAEIKDFSRSFGFLNILVDTPLPIATAEIIAAALRRMSRVYDEPHPFLVAAGKELAILLSNDFSQLKATLGRLRE
jgi:hypothetical protein